MFFDEHDGRFDFQAAWPSALEDHRCICLQVERWQSLMIIDKSDVLGMNGRIRGRFICLIARVFDETSRE